LYLAIALFLVVTLLLTDLFHTLRIHFAVNLCGLHVMRIITGTAKVYTVTRGCDEASRFESASIYRLRGRAALAEGDIDSAHRYLLAAHKLKPEDELISYWFGIAEESKGNYASAILLMYQAGKMEYWPDLDAWLQGSEEVRKARIKKLVGALEGQEISQYAHYKLATLVYEIDQELASWHFEQSVYQLDDRELYGRYVDIGWFYVESHDYVPARAWAQRAANEYPTDQYPYEILGAIYRAEGDLKSATRMLQIALSYSYSPRHAARVQATLGSIYVQLEQYDAAIPMLKDAAQNHKDPFWAYYWLVEAYRGKDDCLGAKEACEQLVTLSLDVSRANLVKKQEAWIASHCSSTSE